MVVILVNTVAIFLLILPIATSCTAYHYQKLDGALFDGSVINSVKDRLVRVSDCQRACQLMQNCRAINMHWIGGVDNFGYCDFTDLKVKKPLLYDQNFTIYALCPAGMTFSWRAQRCYEVVKRRKTWLESQRHCRSIHYQAHLTEIIDNDQQEVFNDITAALSECRFTSIGTEYIGHVNETKGIPCQSWFSQSPHEHDMLNKTMAWILEENYCRNVDNGARPWCYAAVEKPRWGYCDIPFCSDVIEPNPYDRTHPSLGLWLGARRSGNTDVTWSSTSQSLRASSFRNFDSGEPDPAKDCLRIMRGVWSMADCSEVKAFVCEF